jgi:hypothetical protein
MKAMLLVTAATLALVSSAYAAGNTMSGAGGHGTSPRALHVPPKGMTTLYDQNIADVNYGWFSQSLSSYPQYDEYLADDFVVPAGHTWKVQQVDTTGFYFTEPGPAKTVNILIWGDKKGAPNKKAKLVECDNIKPKSGGDTGAFQIKLPKSCAVSLTGSGKKGTPYWLTVQANLKSETTSGYWAWQQNSNIANNAAEGYYYGGSSGAADPKCSTRFETIQDCWTAGAPVDLAFALYGKDSGG